MNRILLIGIHSTVGLASLWSLSKKNIKIIGISHVKGDSGLYSKYLEKKYVVNFNIENQYYYVREIIRIAKKNNVQGILCHHEIQMILLNKYRSEIEPSIKLLFPDSTSINKILDKSSILEAAKKVDINVPETMIVKNLNDVKNSIRYIKFPAIIKLADINNFPKIEKWKFKCKYFETKKQWLRFAQDIEKSEAKYLLQEYIHGKYIGLGIAISKNKILAKFQWIAIREYEPGLGGLRKSIKPDYHLIKKVEQLFKEIKYDGVCEVEFRGDPLSKKYSLMEINPRLWGGVRLPMACGIDFPYLAFCIYSNRDVKINKLYETNIISRNSLGDLKWFLKAFFKNSYKNEMPNIRYKRKNAFIDYLKSIGKASIHDLENIDDIKPALFHYLKKMSEIPL